MDKAIGRVYIGSKITDAKRVGCANKELLKRYEKLLEMKERGQWSSLDNIEQNPISRDDFIINKK